MPPVQHSHAGRVRKFEQPLYCQPFAFGFVTRPAQIVWQIFEAQWPVEVSGLTHGDLSYWSFGPMETQLYRRFAVASMGVLKRSEDSNCLADFCGW